MKLNWRRFSSAEDRFETWIGQRHQDRVFAGETAPVAPCPDEAFLQQLARKSRQISLADPRVDHAANCPTCMSTLLALRQENRTHQRRIMLALTALSCVVIAAVAVSLIRFGVFTHPAAPNLAVASKTVDLWNVGTYRGEQASPLQSVSLPAALVKLTIILPRFSGPGEYVVAVTRDQNGSDVMAQGRAQAVESGDREEVSVDLNLRQARAGSYFLSTTREQDKAAYYYPLRIK
jgi:hypothetical protein